MASDSQQLDNEAVSMPAALRMASTNVTSKDLGIKGAMTWDDATWILTSAFIIFTMQSGFGMLESGAVASKNTVNIMVKNVVDVVFGGLTYWMFGFALSFGSGPYSNPFCGVGDFFVDTQGEDMGLIYATFVFQLSFATTATTIVSGAMAERTNLTAYIIFSFCNTIVYCIPAHWLWADNGFLAQLGAVDFAGSGVVHLVGATSGMVATLMLKPRTDRYDSGHEWPPLINPVNAIIGTFMLWWGWLAFNCGSTFGISGGKWMLASKAAFTTLLSSFSGGITGIVVSLAEYHDVIGRMKRWFLVQPPRQDIDSSYFAKKGKYDVSYLINAILGSLVSITASCPLVRPYESVIIGVVGALCTLGWAELMNVMRIDDPVSAVAVHGASGLWGMLAVGLFVEDDNLEDLTNNRNGLLHGGGFYLLGVQVLAIVCEITWSVVVTFILLFVIEKTMGLRVSLEEEMLGADFCEHGLRQCAAKSTQLGRCNDQLCPDPDPSQSEPRASRQGRSVSFSRPSLADSTTRLVDEVTDRSWSSELSKYACGFGNESATTVDELEYYGAAVRKRTTLMAPSSARHPSLPPEQQQPQKPVSGKLHPRPLSFRLQQQHHQHQHNGSVKGRLKAKLKRKKHNSPSPSPSAAGSADSGYSPDGQWPGFGFSFSSDTGGGGDTPSSQRADDAGERTSPSADRKHSTFSKQLVNSNNHDLGLSREGQLRTENQSMQAAFNKQSNNTNKQDLGLDSNGKLGTANQLTTDDHNVVVDLNIGLPQPQLLQENGKHGTQPEHVQLHV